MNEKELSQWWNRFNLIEKILIKDFLVDLCNEDFQILMGKNLRNNFGKSEIEKQKIIDALIKMIKA